MPFGFSKNTVNPIHRQYFTLKIYTLPTKHQLFMENKIFNLRFLIPEYVFSEFYFYNLVLEIPEFAHNFFFELMTYKCYD